MHRSRVHALKVRRVEGRGSLSSPQSLPPAIIILSKLSKVTPLLHRTTYIMSMSSTSTTAQSQEHIPRPPNCWLLYLSDKSREEQYAGLGGKQMTPAIGKRWRKESKEVKKVYKRLAEEAKAQHKLRYPDWSFKPAKSKKSSSKKGKKKSKRSPTPPPSPHPLSFWSELTQSFSPHDHYGLKYNGNELGPDSIELTESPSAWQRLTTDSL
ncbi:hypothetical protein D9613_008952 [Agrocybe pediades]|uniref:HMG box domain-containing protein n=1 Tax=Agrocybe pediades TaxID=84607 RepID=A0A8H4QV67_9AGAR|nr:hypothetical protein D9613_008952 [Agrocybe pediades]